MDKIEKNILEWSGETFPNAGEQAFKEKLLSECRELIEAIESGDMWKIMEESADVFIVTVSLRRSVGKFHGMSFGQFIYHKLGINKERIWGEETSTGDRVRVR